ncbi:MAG: universal stress protein [Gemmataceae bacterium]
MLTIRTILHGTDFSEHSAYALELASALARDYGARLVLVHVAPPPVVFYGESALPLEPKEYLQSVREKLEQIPVGEDIPVERVLLEGDAVDGILRTAEDKGADLIVLGTHGRTGLGRLLLGSVAEQVVRRANCPVLTVRVPVHLNE